MAFSTSSLTTLAGRSITSPAAMRLTISGLSWRIGTSGFLANRDRTPNGHTGLPSRYPAMHVLMRRANPTGRLSLCQAPLLDVVIVPVVP